MSKAITNGQFEQIIHTAINKSRELGFLWFINNVFSFSFEHFIKGEFLTSVAEHHRHKWTMAISARDHFKSTRFYAEIMFEIFTTQTDLEAHYFSYQGGMSKYHIAKIKKMIENNPFFPEYMFKDLTKDAQGVIRIANPYGAVYTLNPQGLLSFKRGIHAERIYIDDPLKDPENKLAPTVIYKINNIIKTEMFPMVKKGGICRIVGTPQTNQDFFFDEKLQTRFNTSIRPAIVDEANKVSIFPEWKPYDELDDIRNTIGEKSFNQEYMCKPAYSENSYIERKDLMACVNKDLKQELDYKGSHDVVAGFDIGKKSHPSHLAVFERIEIDGEYYYRQLVSKWFDHMDYSKQIEVLKQVIEDYKVDTLHYDNTRGEFELFAEQGKLPNCMKPVVFSMRQNNAMASVLSKTILDQRVEFLNDQRQLDQLLQVNNDLQAIESPLGHGDSFWSNALALMSGAKKEYRIRSL